MTHLHYLLVTEVNLQNIIIYFDQRLPVYPSLSIRFGSKSVTVTEMPNK